METRAEITANRRLWPNVGIMLAHRLRRWSNIMPTVGQRLVFAGIRTSFRLGLSSSRDIEPLLVQCWASVVDGGPTLNHQWLNVSRLLGNPRNPQHHDPYPRAMHHV